MENFKHYYVNKNKQNNGDNEVHKEECKWIPDVLNREYLGYFDNCRDAVRKAREKGYNANGCYYCSEDCHTS